MVSKKELAEFVLDIFNQIREAEISPKEADLLLSEKGISCGPVVYEPKEFRPMRDFFVLDEFGKKEKILRADVEIIQDERIMNKVWNDKTKI